jgi:hypothetical protein
LIEQAVFTFPSSERLFNPYRDEDPALDIPGAAAVRRANLLASLAALRRRPEVLVVGEAVGFRGARFSGVPLVSERMLAAGSCGFPGCPTSTGRPLSEATATIFRRVAAGFADRTFVWNAVPLHPHHSGRPLTNRTPTAAELAAFRPLLARVAALVRPRLTVALGRHAAASLAALGLPHRAVRHPANGGATAFAAGWAAAWGEAGLLPALQLPPPIVECRRRCAERAVLGIMPGTGGG